MRTTAMREGRGERVVSFDEALEMVLRAGGASADSETGTGEPGGPRWGGCSLFRLRRSRPAAV